VAGSSRITVVHVPLKDCSPSLGNSLKKTQPRDRNIEDVALLSPRNPVVLLSEAYHPKRNSIGAIRLIASAAVLFGHARPFGLYGQDPLVTLTHNQLATGRWPVDVFFVLSGFLLSVSYQRSTLVTYLRNRFLRIFPAFWVCLLVCGVAVPAMFGVSPSLWYIVRSAPLIAGVGKTIPGLFETVNYTSDVNGALWTLPFELYCYVSLPLLAMVGMMNRFGAVLTFLMFWGVFTVAILFPELFPFSPIVNPCRLFTFFYAGVLLDLFKDRVKMSLPIFWMSILVLLLATIVGVYGIQRDAGMFYIVAPLPLAYTTMYIAVNAPFYRLNRDADVSYGIYIYGTVVLQVMTAFGVNASYVSFSTYMGIAFAVTIPLAYASWYLVEKPAMKCRR
jgi:peptidoglycan/LPS O-acetylase OafA/YrhL